MTFQIKRLHPLATIPMPATEMAAGYDLIAAIDAPMSIRNGEKSTLIPTGLAICIGSASVAGLLLPRSGLGHKQGLVLGNTLGLIDGDYQNQWFISAWNRGQQDEIVINPGDRIAQVIFVPVIHPIFHEVEEFSAATERGLGGFGSTGVGGVSVRENCPEAKAAHGFAVSVAGSDEIRYVGRNDSHIPQRLSDIITPRGSLGEEVPA